MARTCRLTTRIRHGARERTSIHDEVANISLVAINATVVILFFGSAAFGSWLGRRIRERSEEVTDAWTLATASMGLALLIAFTYSIALARSDLRRQAVSGEANAIWSAANDAPMLPQPQRTARLDLLRRYTRLRIALGGPSDPGKCAETSRRPAPCRRNC